MPTNNAADTLNAPLTFNGSPFVINSASITIGMSGSTISVLGACTFTGGFSVSSSVSLIGLVNTGNFAISGQNIAISANGAAPDNGYIELFFTSNIFIRDTLPALATASALTAKVPTNSAYVFLMLNTTDMNIFTYPGF